MKYTSTGRSSGNSMADVLILDDTDIRNCVYYIECKKHTFESNGIPCPECGAEAVLDRYWCAWENVKYLAASKLNLAREIKYQSEIERWERVYDYAATRQHIVELLKNND